MTSDKSKLGSVYVCPVCGAEVSVIRRGRGCPDPFCCNVAMELIEVVNLVFQCAICRSEVMVIKVGSDNLEPYCCNKPMGKVNG